MDQRFRQPEPGADARGQSRRPSANAALRLAHDFRNLLQLATSSASLARREMLARRDVKLASMLEDAVQALDRANLLAQRLSGPESDRGDPENVFLQEAVPALRSLLSQALGGHVQFESLVAADLAPVRCDRLQLENVLLNLTLNARQAMPRGGTLMIEAVPCTCEDHAGCIALSVTDTGHGMSAEVAGRAFEPFFSTRLLDGGTGLGLYNAREFAEALGGSTQLSTKENCGTRVLLHLPGNVSRSE